MKILSDLPYMKYQSLDIIYSYCIWLTNIISVLISVTSVPRHIWLLYLAYQFISVLISVVYYMVKPFNQLYITQYFSFKSGYAVWVAKLTKQDWPIVLQ